MGESRQELISLAKQAAGRYNLDPALVCAIVEQETEGTWNPLCIRFEPAFLKHYIEPMMTAGKIHAARLVSLSTEEFARAFSWGLMQVLGEVAREHGFAGVWLSELLVPKVGLDIGCKVLASKLNASGGGIEAALLLWNGGGNSLYPDQVLARKQTYES